LNGGAGKDAFIFNTALNARTNVDKIIGFSVKEDTIRLDDAVFRAIGKALTRDEFVIGAAAEDADDRIIYNKATGALIYDANGNGDGQSVLFAKVGAGLAPTHQDFLII
jgi:serralysin